MRCLVAIPARLKSTRLPEKPLKDIAGKTLIQRVYEQACRAKLPSLVVIATDDQCIAAAARGFGAEVVMTSEQAATGSDRVAEVAAIFKSRGQEFDFIANVQGDMPFISPDAIDLTIAVLQQADSTFGMSTLATPITSREEFERPAAVKVVMGTSERALYFSRAPVPFARDPEEAFAESNVIYGHKHIGLYVFRPEVLARLGSLPLLPPERREKLEQLRALAAGIAIRVAIVPRAKLEPSVEVDTPDDLELARALALEFDRTQR